MDVIVVGGGVVGLSCAVTLARECHVILVQRGKCGEGTSAANAGWITQLLATPVPAPGVLKQALMWSVKRDSPLRVIPRREPSFWRWAREFVRATERTRFCHGTSALLGIGQEAVPAFERLQARGVRIEIHRRGLLCVALSKEALRRWQVTTELLNRLGWKDELNILGHDEVRDLEPAITNAVVGGVFAPRDCHIQPEQLVAALTDAARVSDVAIHEDTEVTSLRRHHAKWLATVEGGNIEGDAVVVAAGAWSAQLLRALGMNMLLEPGKGYSITAALTGSSPSRPVYLTEARVAVTPLPHELRIGGALEVVGFDNRLRRARLAAIVRSSRSYLPDVTMPGPVEKAIGFRPLSGDGLPLIGDVPHFPGLYVATGHGMIGVTLAPITGEIIAKLVVERHCPVALEPFRPTRFCRSWPPISR